ncbi:hypothetical protein D9758_014411 [Tetrapyrgos nigripes]|uniref:Uncharacterized protein n=1 Tax=Tetrapyrgos nigripes TaxID=182062 RepID=A0A8H5CN05_9AGAR|nr:hypothetical protein D9758_014411 [Tetrapyrgos nigripes]
MSVLGLVTPNPSFMSSDSVQTNDDVNTNVKANTDDRLGRTEDDAEANRVGERLGLGIEIGIERAEERQTEQNMDWDDDEGQDDTRNTNLHLLSSDSSPSFPVLRYAELALTLNKNPPSPSPSTQPRYSFFLSCQTLSDSCDDCVYSPPCHHHHHGITLILVLVLAFGLSVSFQESTPSGFSSESTFTSTSIKNPNLIYAKACSSRFLRCSGSFDGDDNPHPSYIYLPSPLKAKPKPRRSREGGLTRRRS